jgi:hypothetical protein
MSTSYHAALVYGLTYELANALINNLDDLIDEGEIDTFSPYYDDSREESLVGVEIQRSPAYGYREVDVQNDESAQDRINTEGRALEEIFGEENLKIYITTVGY